MKLYICLCIMTQRSKSIETLLEANDQPQKAPVRRETSTSVGGTSTFVSVEIQTIIKVSPHVIDRIQNATITSNKKLNTEVSMNPDDNIKQFYSLLQYTPYSDIKKDCLKEIDLPRKARLQFKTNKSTIELNQIMKSAQIHMLGDDDGVSEFCVDLLTNGWNDTVLKTRHIGTQTEVYVKPHVLDMDVIAKIYLDNGIQTGKVCENEYCTIS